MDSTSISKHTSGVVIQQDIYNSLLQGGCHESDRQIMTRKG